jgi:hypothetical protein
VIVSQYNKCATIVVAIIYMLFKYKWNVHRSLEYINSRKADIEITKSIIKRLQKLELAVEVELQKRRGDLRIDWTIDEKLKKPSARRDDVSQ